MNFRPNRWLVPAALATFALLVFFTTRGRILVGQASAAADAVSWGHLSSDSGDIPSPSASQQQTAALVVDVNKDGRNDFVIATRRDPGPSLLWFERTTNGWERHIIDTSSARIEAGGDTFDIDGDGDEDIVMGGDGGSNQIWWWENPLPDGNPNDPWTRRLIKDSGDNRHHDMLFADPDNNGKVDLVFWNQNAKSLFMTEIPADPRQTSPWLDMATGENVYLVGEAPANRYEGLTIDDIDLDGKPDLVGGGYWFKHTTGHSFTMNTIAPAESSRVAVGQLVSGGRPEVIIAPGDSSGMVRWYEWNGSSWVGHDLISVDHAHSLELGDVDQDGKLDIFLGEMAFAPSDDNHNPESKTWVFYGDDAGNFSQTTVASGIGQHESRLDDLDGDGDLDILGKPYTGGTPRLDIWLNGEGGQEPPVCEALEDWDRKVVGDSDTHRNVLVATADLNGDNRLDIITGKHWYANPGSGGNWQQNLVGGSFNQFAVSADFDNDGDIDLLGTVSGDTASNRTQIGDTFVWARNNGSGSFTILDNIEAGSGDFLQGAVTGSFAPGANQVILSWHSRTSQLQSLEIPADPSSDTWALSTLPTSAQQFEDLSRGDIDRDGDQDVLLGTVWLQNQSNGQWNDHTLFSPSAAPDRNELADINGDGRVDAVVGYEAINNPGVLAWYQAPADPTQPWSENVIDTVPGPMSVGTADLDGDGDLDVVVGEHSTQNPTSRRLLIYENTNGQGTSWQQHVVHVGDEHHDGALVVDIDGDGDLDIVSIGWTHGRVHLYENTGCGGSTPQPPTATSPAATPTSTAQPSATPTSTVGPTATQTLVTPGATNTPTPVPTTTATPSSSGFAKLFLSSAANSSVGGVAFADEDILAFDITSGTWSLWFDGSDVGLAGSDVDAFTQYEDGLMLMSVESPVTLPGMGKVDDSDIILFRPDNVGPNTSGTFEMFLDGSDHQLTTNAEDIDAIALTGEGGLLISTRGVLKINGLRAEDEDLVRIQLSPSGLPTGDWSHYLDGSAVDLKTTNENINGVWMQGTDILLVTFGNFVVNGVNGKNTDIFRCQPSPAGPITNCNYDPNLTWQGSSNGFTKRIDAFAFSGSAPGGDGPAPGSTATPPIATSTPSPTATSVGQPSPTATATSVSQPTVTATPLPGGENWVYGANGYRVGISVNAAGYARTDKMADVEINFTQALAAAGVSDAFSADSLRVVEINAQGEPIDTTVPFQFDPAANFNANNNATGTLVMQLTGTTSASGVRSYHVYFDTVNAGIAAVNVTSQLTFTASVQDEGFDSYRIQTDAGTYYYHKDGGGFSSLMDSDGNDWIGWSSANGTAGDYRGVPNMVHPKDGGYFHPGRTTATSTLLSAGPLKVTFQSTSDNGAWQTEWEIYPTHARLTVLDADGKYYLLYEGTPGGALEAGDEVVRSNGSETSGYGSWEGDVVGEEWAYFRDATQNRSLFTIHEEEDNIIDAYRAMDDTMTVLGFGRNGANGRYLTQTPQRFIFGLTNRSAFGDVSAAIRSVYKPLGIAIGSVETGD